MAAGMLQLGPRRPERPVLCLSRMCSASGTGRTAPATMGLLGASHRCRPALLDPQSQHLYRVTFTAHHNRLGSDPLPCRPTRRAHLPAAPGLCLWGVRQLSGGEIGHRSPFPARRTAKSAAQSGSCWGDRGLANGARGGFPLQLVGRRSQPLAHPAHRPASPRISACRTHASAAATCRPSRG
jgi:hypothetical protein